MRLLDTKRLIYCALFSVCLLSGAKAQVADVQYLSTFGSSTHTETNINIRQYSSADTAGGGQFILGPPLCIADGGTVIVDNSSHCYYRQFSGPVHLTWYGVVNGSDVTTILPKALTAAQASTFSSPNYTVDTDGLYVSMNPSTDLEIYAGVRLTCDANPGQNQTSGGYSKYVALPGSITITNATTSISLDDNAQLDHCILLTTGASNITLDLSAHTGFRSAMSNALNMVQNHATGVKCIQHAGCRIHDDFIGGFDNAIEASQASHLKLSDIAADADVGIYLTNIHDPVQLSNMNVQPYLTMSPGNDYQFNLMPTAGNSGGYCQLALDTTKSNPATSDLLPGDPIYAAGIQYPLGCNGFTTVQGVSGTTITVSNLFTTPAISGSWAANSQVIQLANVSGVWPGQLVKGTGIPTGTTVVDVSPYSQSSTFTSVSPEVVVSNSLGSAGSASLTFCNPDSSTPPVNCGTAGTISASPAAFAYPSMRPWAGASDAGKATYHYSSGLGTGTCVQAGNPYTGTDNFGVQAVNLQCFGHEVSYAFAGTGPGGCVNCESDSHAELDDLGQIGLLSIGTTSRVGYQSMLLNGGGGLVVDSTSANCQSISGLETNPNTDGQLAVRVADGCVTLTGLNGTGINASDWVLDTVSGGTNGASITGAYFPKGSVFYQDPANGSPITSCIGNTFKDPNCANLVGKLVTVGAVGATCTHCTATGTNDAMEVTLNSGGTGTFTVRFTSPGFINPPVCTLTPKVAGSQAVSISSITGTTLNLTASPPLSGNETFEVLCLGR